MASFVKVRKRKQGNFTRTHSFGGKSGSRTTTSTNHKLGKKSGITISSSFGTDGKSYRTVTTRTANNGYRRERTMTSSRSRKSRRQSGSMSPIGFALFVVFLAFVGIVNWLG